MPVPRLLASGRHRRDRARSPHRTVAPVRHPAGREPADRPLLPGHTPPVAHASVPGYHTHWPIAWDHLVQATPAREPDSAHRPLAPRLLAPTLPALQLAPAAWSPDLSGCHPVP